MRTRTISGLLSSRKMLNLPVLLLISSASTTTVLSQNIVQLQNVSAEVNNLKIELITHFNCRHKPNSQWDEKIVFPSGKQADLQADPQNPGCYKIGGDAQIKSTIYGKLQMHIEMGHTVGQRYEIDECYQYDKNTGCGGFGSCLYCDVCDAVANAKRDNTTNAKGAALWITHDGKRIDCLDGLRLSSPLRRRFRAPYVRRPFHQPLGEIQGIGRLEFPNFELTYKSINVPAERGTFIHFCLPSTEQFLASRGITKQLWEDLSRDRHGRPSSSIPRKIGIYLVIRIFESDVSSKVLDQYQRLENFQLAHNGRQPTRNEMKLMPFNREIWADKGFIGCHRIVGNLFLDS